jgi:hypothetical protein
VAAKHLLVTIRIVGVSQIHHQAFCGAALLVTKFGFMIGNGRLPRYVFASLTVRRANWRV